MRPPRSIGILPLSIGTPSASGDKASEIALVVDYRDNSIWVSPHTGFPQTLEPGRLSSAISLARDYVQGTGKVWQVFTGHGGGEIYVGGFETDRAAIPSHLPEVTDAVSQTVVRQGVDFVDASTRKTFRRLAENWRETRNRIASGADMFMHPAYQQIIGLGERVLPLIFAELNRDLDHWFWALKAITRDDPVPAHDTGNLAAMRTHWLRWAEDHGYQWQPNSTKTPDIRGRFLGYRTSITA